MSEGLAIIVGVVLHEEVVVEVSKSRWAEEIGVSGANSRDLSKGWDYLKHVYI